MIGRRATVCLALLSALLFSAIAVQSASAAPAKNTTLFTCVKTTPGTGTFFDAHCDEHSVSKIGEFEHKKLNSPVGGTTEVTITNETTGGAKSTQTLKGLPFAVKTHLECTTVSGTGSLGNTEPEVGVHKISGKTTTTYTGCTTKEPANCKVKEPIEMKFGFVEGVEGLTGPKGEANAMGIESKAEAGKPIATITLEGEKCVLKGKPFPLEGSIIGTSGPGTEEAQTKHWSGATSVFTAAMTKETLTLAGKPAEYVGTKTVRMKGEESWPITATTCTATEAKC